MKVTLAYAERQLRHWTKKVAELRLTSNASNAKESEKGKETFPPAPPIENRAKEKENNNHDNHVRAREGLTACSQLPTVEEVAAFAKAVGSDVDAAYFWRYYNSNSRGWPRNWQDRLRNWTVNGNPRGRIAPTAAATRASRPVVVNWILCAERCANYRGQGCVCGIRIPPASDDPPRPPEECAVYRPREG